MYLADYHMHSKYSFDGSEELDVMCEQAIRRGLSEIAITDHVDIYTGLPYGELMNFEVPGSVKTYMDVAGLYGELEAVRDRYAGRLTVKVGAELGQPRVNPQAARDFLADYGERLDFIIGSIHNMEEDLDVYYYDFEKIDVAKMYDHYVDWLLELAQNGDFDVMGHLTYPLRYMFERNQMRLNLKPYEEKFRLLFKYLTEKGRGIELNVSGLYRAMRDTMPPMQLLKLYRECGGEIITIGSDAHKAENIGLFQKEAREMLMEAGFRYMTIFAQRKPDFIKL
ncbi:MAG: histidinol-phosphatase HisJ family protein [Coprococcus sp.]